MRRLLGDRCGRLRRQARPLGPGGPLHALWEARTGGQENLRCLWGGRRSRRAEGRGAAQGRLTVPIRPENRGRYPADWPAIRAAALDRAGELCECEGECARHPGACGRGNGSLIPGSTRRVVLTVAHLDHTPENCEPENLRAWCQRCHLAYDQAHHQANAALTRARRAADDRRRRGEQELFGEGEG